MKMHELSDYLFSELWTYLYFAVDPFHGNHISYFEQLNNALDSAMNDEVYTTIYIDKINKNNLKIMNRSKEKFQKKYNIKNLEWDTKN